MFNPVNEVEKQFVHIKQNNSAHTLSPLFAVAFYKGSDGSVLSTYHPVSNFGELMAGQFVSHQQLTKELLTVVGEPHSDENGWVDKRILFENRNLIVWHSKARKSPMWFRLDNSQVKLNAHWPHLVFSYNKAKQAMNVFATLRANPKQDTKLYHAPICNTSSTGRVCQGTATLPNYDGETTSRFLTLCEATIYDSLFTHVNHRQTFNANKTRGEHNSVETGTHVGIWQKLCAERRAPKASDLAPIDLRLADLVRGA